jgi:hypothetical protein
LGTEARRRLEHFGETRRVEDVPVDVQAEKKKRSDAISRAEKLVVDAGK